VKVATAVAALVVALSVAAVVGASPPPPGTPTQVKALVAAAPSITKVPANVTPTLQNASNDSALTRYPSLTPCISGSTAEPACVFGDTHGTHTMVLFGDSHALMWFPALDAVAKSAKWRLVALMNYGCPVANVTVENVLNGKPDPGCPIFRSHMIKRIVKLDPALVVVSEGFYTVNAAGGTITNAQWTAALAKSLGALRVSHGKRVVIGQSFLIPQPLACLATASASSASIQTCSQPWATPSFTAELAADRAGAKQVGVPYVNEIPWTCSITCTVVIGTMIAYNSSGHLSATYDAYLANVLRLALKASMG
jgi:hypothetical protein